MHTKRSQPSFELAAIPLDIVEQTRTNWTWQDLVRCSTSSARQIIEASVSIKIPALPLGIIGTADEQSMIVAVPIEFGDEQLNQVRFSVGMPCVPEYVERDILIRAIHASYYGQEQQVADAAIRVTLESTSSILSSHLVECRLDTPTMSSNAVPELVNAILNRALSLDVSDIHLEPQNDVVRIRYRQAGLLIDDNSFVIPRSAGASLVRRIKVLANLDTTVIGTPQEGGFSMSIDTWKFRSRVSVIPQLYGEKVVIRLIESLGENVPVRSSGNSTESLLGLGMSKLQVKQVLSGIAADRGAILVTGPTGSGKSTLLYNLLGILNSGTANLISLEDPVERTIPGVNQIPVNSFGGENFKDLLKATLRQDPNVLMVGEVRDQDTAETVLSAAISGMLVLTTIHAGSCLEVFVRLQQLGVSMNLLSLSVRLIVSQRLARRVCPHCRSWVSPTLQVQKVFQLDQRTKVAQAGGCAKCDGGVTGRIGIYELLQINEPLRQLLRNSDANSNAIRGLKIETLGKAALDSGYEPLAYSIREALLRGVIDSTSALKAIGLNPSVVQML